MKKPLVCVLRTDGINCDEETFYAFEKQGADCRLVHVNQLRKGSEKLASPNFWYCRWLFLRRRCSLRQNPGGGADLL